MSKLNGIARAILRHPLLWGGVATAALYGALDAGVVDEPLVLRYFAGHWTSYVCTTMFLVGLAAMIVKASDLAQGFRWRNLPLFDGLPASDLPVSDASLLVERLDKQPAAAQRGYLIARMRAALDYLLRKGAPDTLEDELRALAELDAERKHASFGIVRTMLWTMPFVGALGTILGLAEAISKNVPEGATGPLPANLPPGFELILDATVLAMLYTASLLLAMLVADHFESRILAAVDARASRELIGRFRAQSGAKGIQPISHVSSGAGAGDAMVETMEKIAERQTGIWQASLEAATKHWEEQTELLKKQIESSAASGGGGGGAASAGGPGGRGGSGTGGAGTAGSAMGGSAGGGLATGGEVDLAGLQEAILHSAGLGSWNRIDPAHHEIMRELSEVVRSGCRNWPYRKVLRGAVGPAPAGARAKDEDWLERG